MYRRILPLFIFLAATQSAQALDWIGILPNPAASRDLAMGTSTIAADWGLQSGGINPAGFRLFGPETRLRATLLVNPGGLWQLRNAIDHDFKGRSAGRIAADGLRILTTGAAVQRRVVAVAVVVSQPVMLAGDRTRYADFEQQTALSYHQNSILTALALHPRVSLGGRVDRYYAGTAPDGEGYSYGLILRPRGINVGVQYQRFPRPAARIVHPLDRRSDQCTSAGLALEREQYTITVQVMNLTRTDQPAFLEPHAGLEWRPVRAIALRAGGTQFSRSPRWAWTTGIGLLDANWLRRPRQRTLVPDDILQASVGVIYNKRTPELGIGSLTLTWRF